MTSMTKNAILITQTIVIIVLLLFIFFGTEEGKKIVGSRELTLEEKYEKIKDKSIEEMTPDEWTISNLYNMKQAESNEMVLDTMPYEEALARNKEFKEQLLRELDPCTEDKMISAFHEIMEFNMPNDRYKKEEIKWKNMGDCVIHINVFTREPQYGWKTFWVFEIRHNSATEQYELQTVRREFLGEG